MGKDSLQEAQHRKQRSGLQASTRYASDDVSAQDEGRLQGVPEALNRASPTPGRRARALALAFACIWLVAFAVAILRSPQEPLPVDSPPSPSSPLEPSRAPRPEPLATAMPSPQPQGTPDWRASFPVLQRTTWGHKIHGKHVEGLTQLDPPDLTPRVDPRLPSDFAGLNPSPQRAYSLALEVFDAGRDGTSLLTIAARGGHLEAAFLVWFWDSRRGPQRDLEDLLSRNEPQVLLESFGERRGGIPRALWAAVSRPAQAQSVEKVLARLTSGEAGVRAPRNRKLWPDPRPSDLELTLQELGDHKVGSQDLVLGPKRFLTLRVRVSVVAMVRVRFTESGQRQESEKELTEEVIILSPLYRLGQVR